ncbi:MAG: hypothetical protein ACP5HM_03635 [Anaerolineae bacterium]
MRRWLWILPALALGVGLGLLLGWVVMPPPASDVTLAHLHPLYRREYVRLVAFTYAVTGDLEAARTHLTDLAPADPLTPLQEVTEALIAEEAPEPIVGPLVRLARDLDAETPAMSPYLESEP